MRLLAVMLLLCCLVSTAYGKTICVFSLIGNHGELWEQMQDYQLKAMGWGEHFSLRAMTDERVAAEDLKAGQCDGLMMTGIRARQFVPFTGSIDAIGGLDSYQGLHVLIRLLADPRLADSMRHGAYETAGIVPIGAAYLFINDHTINSVSKLAGHSMAVFSNDRAQLLMTQRLGLNPVPSDVTNFAQKFNNGVVDMVAAPAVAYMPLELYHGVGVHGIVVKMPLVELTMQLVLYRDRFSEDFMARSRSYFADQFDNAMKIIQQAEDGILFFYPPPDKDREGYVQLMNDSRTFLIESGVYDKSMMVWLKKVRCKVTPTRAECASGRPW